MKKIIALMSLLVLGVVADGLRGAEEEGFRDLFNGKDLAGFKIIGSAVWKVEDGVIVGGQEGDPKRSGSLVTEQKFKDFELTFEFMIDEHGKYNSGVYLRQVAGKGGRLGYQVNIGRGEAGEYCGGIYTDKWLAKGDEKDEVRKKLEWNSLRISVRGGHLMVWLNGVKVSDYTDEKPAEGWTEAGVLAFQTYGAEGHSGWVKFRGIRVKELKE